MSDQSPIAVVGAFFEEVSGGDLDAIERRTSPEVAYVIYGEDDATRSAVPWAGRHLGHAAVKSAFASIRGALRIDDFAVATMLAEGPVVAVFGHYRATAIATGRSFTTLFAQRATVADGLIVECLMSEDSHAVAEAIRNDTGARP